jgi:hypothetical protein
MAWGLFSYYFLDSPALETYLRDMSDALTIPAKNLQKLALAPTGGEGWVRGPLRAHNCRNSDSLDRPLTPALSPGGGEGIPPSDLGGSNNALENKGLAA